MTHWTEELFKEHPELFLGAFEARLEQSYDEVAGLLHCLSEQGFQPQRLLDLNCGIGRHSLELAKQGIRVVGTDISPDYIDIANKMAAEQGVADRAGFRVADMRRIAAEMENEKPFDGVVCLWTAFGFYDEETNIDVLRQCRGLVGEGGCLALDIVNRDWLVQNFQGQGFTRWKDRIVLEERHLNPISSRIYNTWTFLRQQDDETYRLEKEIKLDHHVWSLHELATLLEKAGWRFQAAYPGFEPGGVTAEEGLSAAADEVLQSRMLLVIGRK